MFNQKTYPERLQASDVRNFLNHLANDLNVASLTQNQALSALLFLYRNVLKLDLPNIENIEWSKKAIRIPVVLSVDEVSRLISYIPANVALAVKLIPHYIPQLLNLISPDSLIRILLLLHSRNKGIHFFRQTFFKFLLKWMWIDVIRVKTGTGHIIDDDMDIWWLI